MKLQSSNFGVQEQDKQEEEESMRRQEELREAEFALELLGGELSQVFSLSLPDENSERFIIEFDKKRKTPRDYPRKPGTPNKKPLV